MEEHNGVCDYEITKTNHVMENHVFNGLPSIAALNVLKFLDPITLRRLRGISRFTKWLIDSTLSVMKKLRVYIQDEFRMEEIIKSEVNWSNIQIPSELCNVKLIPFLSRFRTSITRIKIVNDKESICPQSLNPIDLINILVELNGGFLETLCIRADLAGRRTPDARSYLLATEEFDMSILKTLLENSKEILRINLRRLRRLEFREMSSNSVILDLLLKYFYDMCRNLVYIRLPRLSSSEESRKDKCSSLTSYMEGIVGSPRKYGWITIDFGSVGFGSDCADRGFNGHLFYPLISDHFMNLLKSFVKENLRVRLLNVPPIALRGKNPLSDFEKEMLNRYVYSINLIEEIVKGSVMQRMYFPLNCQVKTYLWTLGGTPAMRVISNSIPLAFNVTTVRIHEFAPDDPYCFLDLRLGGAVYPTVVSLMISKEEEEYFDSPLTAILSRTFPNVRKLYLCGCRRLDYYSDESPLQGLNQLEELTLKNCGLSTNHSIGNSALTHSLLHKFPKLRRLRLLS